MTQGAGQHPVDVHNVMLLQDQVVDSSHVFEQTLSNLSGGAPYVANEQDGLTGRDPQAFVDVTHVLHSPVGLYAHLNDVLYAGGSGWRPYHVTPAENLHMLATAVSEEDLRLRGPAGTACPPGGSVRVVALINVKPVVVTVTVLHDPREDL